MSPRRTRRGSAMFGLRAIAIIVGAATVAAAIAATRSSASAAHPTAASARRAAARAYAAHELSTFPIPAGAVRVAGDESIGHQLGLGPPQPGVPGLQDLHRFFVVSGPSPRALIDAVAAAPPAGYTENGTSGSGTVRTGETEFAVNLAVRRLPGSLFVAGIGVAAAKTATGATAVRIDGYATPLTPRPSWEQIPGAARVITATDASWTGTHKRTLAVISDLASVRRIVRFIDSMPIIQPGEAFSCPAILLTSRFISLTFRATHTSSPLATVTNTGCVGLRFTIGRRMAPALDDAGSLTAWLAHRGYIPRRDADL